MLIQSSRLLLKTSSQYKIIPIVESRVQFTQVFDSTQVNSIILRHCSLFDFIGLLDEAHKRKLSVYANVDHIDGIHADSAALRYLSDTLQVTGIISSTPRLLSLCYNFGLEPIPSICPFDSTGLE